MTHDADSDWIGRQATLTPAEAHAAALEMDPGCYLLDSEGDALQPFADIITATSEAPRTPEATISDAAGYCLAMCATDRAAWVFTVLGTQRVEVDARRDMKACPMGIRCVRAYPTCATCRGAA